MAGKRSKRHGRSGPSASHTAASAGTEASRVEAASAMRILAYECTLLLTLVGLLVVRLLLQEARVDAAWIALGCGVIAAGFWQAARLVFPDAPERRHAFAMGNALAVFILLRPWFDGITMPRSNHWFLVYGVALATLWAVRTLRRRERPHASLLPALLFAFVVCASASLTTSVQLDETLRHLLLWTGCFCLFTAAANASRDRLALGIALAALVVAVLAESVYAIVQLRYLLPQSRQLLASNPELLTVYVGQSQMSESLLHRLYANRAFGSFLFPNALGAFLALTLPIALGMFGARATALRRLWRRPPQTARADQETPTPQLRASLNAELSQSASVGVLSWLVAFCVCAAGYYIYVYQIRWYDIGFPQRYYAAPLLLRALPWLLLGGFAPALFGYVAYRIERRRGLEAYWTWVQCLVLLLTLVTGIVALFLTFSRGAMLGLMLATAAVIAFGWVCRVGFRPTAATIACLIAAAALVGAVADEAPTEPPQQTAGAEQSEDVLPTDGPEIATDAEGFWMSRDDLASGSTFRLRLGYWRVGWRMFRDHVLTGTGFGTFGALYPKYQTLEEGDVRAAHNDYLQILSETGIVGFVPFALFVGALLVALARGMRQGRTLEDALLRGGFLAGIAAFLIHCIVDFNLYNPALAMLFFTAAGLACAVAEPAHAAPASNPPTSDAKTRLRIVLPVLALLASAGVLFGVDRIRPTDDLVADFVSENARHRAAAYLLESCDPNGPALADTPRVRYDDARMLIPQTETLTRFGRVMAPRDASRRHWRPLGEGEPLTGQEILLITDRAAAYVAAQDAAAHWIAEAERADRRYPFSVDLAVHLYRWHDILLAAESDPETRRALAERCVAYAERVVERSPEEGVSYRLLADARWVAASTMTGDRQEETFLAALDQYRKARELYPTSRELAQDYGERLEEYAEALARAGREEEAATFARQSREALTHAATIPPRETEQ